MVSAFLCTLTKLWLAAIACTEAGHVTLRLERVPEADLSHPPIEAPPAMPMSLQVSAGIANFRARDAVLMEVAATADAARSGRHYLLVVGDRADLDDALLSGDLRGVSLLVADLWEDAAAGDNGPRLFNFNAGVSARTRSGQAFLQTFSQTACQPIAAAKRSMSGYVRLLPTLSDDTLEAHVHIGFAQQRSIRGTLAVRLIPWLSHMRAAQDVRCTSNFRM